MPATLQRILLLLALYGAASACQYFETQKIPSETFYEQEIATIDWESVDRYPSFPSCSSLTEKEDQKVCFQDTLLAHLYKDLAEKEMELLEETNDTVWIDFNVSGAGVIENTQVDMHPNLQEQLPEFELWVKESLKTLPSSEPALKRGIPVETQFKLPIVIRSEV